MEFVGRAVAVATADKKLRGRVAKVEEGRLHVVLRGGEAAVVNAADIVELQVLAEGAEEPRSASVSPAAAAKPRNSTGKRGGRPRLPPSREGSPGAAPPAPQQRAKPPAQSQVQTQRAQPTQRAQRAQRQPQQEPQRPLKQQQAQRPLKHEPLKHEPAQNQPAQNQQPQNPQPRHQQHAGQQPATAPAWDAAQHEFDFEASHRQFNKTAVFNEIRESAPAPNGSGHHGTYRHDEWVVQRALPAATPLQKVQVQSYMLGQGWSASAVDETAGRGIAGVCLRELGRAAAGATVVVLAGNHAAGARALAAGRVLATRGAAVVAVCVDAAPAQLDRQVPAFRACGGVVVHTQQALYAAVAGQPIALVIDALQGLERVSLEDQVGGPEQLAASRWLVGWANSQAAAARVAVERASTHGSLALRATALASCGWALADAPAPAPQFVVDVGVPQQVLQKLGLPQLYIDFGERLFLSGAAADQQTHER